MLTLFTYLSPFVSPSTFWPMAFLGLTFPWLLLLNLLFCLFWMFRKKRYFIFSLITIALGWGHVRSFIGVGTHNLRQAPQGSIKVTSFNAHSIVPRSSINREKDKAYQAFSALIASEGSHVYCFQEVPGFQRAIKQGKELTTDPIPAELKIIQEKGGIGMLTKLPVADHSYEYFDYETNGYQWADLELPKGGIVRVINIHLQSNGISDMTEEVRAKGTIRDKKTWKSIRGILGKFKRAAQKRATQAEIIAGVIRQSPHPVVVCGDFNDVPLSYTYRVISEGLQDTFKEKGVGLATTYAGHLPALRIDYILVAPAFDILSFYTGRRNFSDHKPVSTIIKPGG